MALCGLAVMVNLVEYLMRVILFLFEDLLVKLFAQLVFFTLIFCAVVNDSNIYFRKDLVFE